MTSYQNNGTPRRVPHSMRASLGEIIFKMVLIMRTVTPNLLTFDGVIALSASFDEVFILVVTR